MRFPALSTLAASALVAAATSNAPACSVCGCSLSSDWGLQDYHESPGFTLGLRYEYFEQDQLRSGPKAVDLHAYTLPADQELQVSTTNRNTILQFDDVLNRHWAVSVQLPHHDRDHRTIAEDTTEVSSSRARGLGDARVLARYRLQGTLAHSWILQCGLKLPTGRFDQDFATGPVAGERLDRGLQLGTGTTDALAGVAWFGRPASHWGLFAQALLDQPLSEREGFAPAASLTVSGGVRWLNAGSITPQLQLNVRTEGRERGVNSDPDNSGGTVALLSPGLSAQLAARISAYAFVQFPLYQRWNGLQLQPRTLLIAGLDCRW